MLGLGSANASATIASGQMHTAREIDCTDVARQMVELPIAPMGGRHMRYVYMVLIALLRSCVHGATRRA